MAKTPLFAAWTWKIPLPEPFDKLSNTNSTSVYSIYCTMAAKKATLHSPILSAVLAYMDTTITPSSVSESAIGTQGDKIIAEYKSRTGETHAVVFNKKNGKFNAGRYDSINSTPRVYSIKAGGQLGTALFFALLPEALIDDEFRKNYDKLGKCKCAGYPNMDEVADAAFILCDNLYRRIENADALPKAAIKLNLPTTGNIPQFTAVNLSKNAYSPNSVLFGTFQILTASAVTSAPATINAADLISRYQLSVRTFTPLEKLAIPTIEDWYVISEEVVTICKHAHLTTSGKQPMRNFMLRGPAGSGKTEIAKKTASCLGLPYFSHTCSFNTEIIDFLLQILPDTGQAISLTKEYPTLMDIQMDAPSAYKKLTGIYDEDITEDEVYHKLLEVIEEDTKALVAQNASGQQFRYVETPFIKAMRNGYLIEIQEPNVIANPGVLVGLNSLLDRCASITLTTGEVVHRHPDTVVIITTNDNYAGCRDMNQSILSRMNLIMDVELLDIGTLTERVMNITGCTDKVLVTDMASTILEINEHCREAMITDGSCGVRELINWVQSYMICGNVLEAAKYTVLSSVSGDPENRAEISASYLEQKFAA